MKKQEEFTPLYNIAEPFFEEETDNRPVIDLVPFLNEVKEYGEWKELIGFLKGKNLNPKLVKKFIEAALEVNKLADE